MRSAPNCTTTKTSAAATSRPRSALLTAAACAMPGSADALLPPLLPLAPRLTLGARARLGRAGGAEARRESGCGAMLLTARPRGAAGPRRAGRVWRSCHPCSVARDRLWLSPVVAM